MKIQDYQNQLRQLANINDVEIEEMELEDWLNIIGITDYEIVLLPVNKLIRFDLFYTTYNRYGEDVCYMKTYNELKPYDFPFSNPSYNNGIKPLVPHIKYIGITKRVPNEVIKTLPFKYEHHF